MRKRHGTRGALKKYWRKRRFLQFRIKLKQLSDQHLLKHDLFLKPCRHCRQVALDTLRRESDVGLQQSLELEEGFIVKDDVLDTGQWDIAARRQNRTACFGKPASCFLRVNRSSCAAATICPSRNKQAALS